MSWPPDNLMAALEGIAKFHDAADIVAAIDFMDTSEELYLRWNGAFVRRRWFAERFSADQQAALADFDAFFQALSAKYNKLPPIRKFMTSRDGRELSARAAQLLHVLNVHDA